MSGDMARQHDPDDCHDGDGCKDCEIARLRAKLKRTATVAVVSPEARARALTGVVARAKAALGGGAALLLATLLGGCAVPAEAIEQARTECAIAHGHAADEALPIEARLIGADEERAWDAQHVALTGDHVPDRAAWGALPAWLEAARADATAPRAATPAGDR